MLLCNDFSTHTICHSHAIIPNAIPISSPKTTPSPISVKFKRIPFRREFNTAEKTLNPGLNHELDGSGTSNSTGGANALPTFRPMAPRQDHDAPTFSAVQSSL